ncbi:hypothetical protein F0562_029500 [Nyssa sinensis]|uniref:Chromo domain-containing protein n=1 Tax=Nyssa sinensis TaxID=561372 RepID=A0A5J5B580_9ASTE|nr:hypothetical protein F0562_029500 [Nyssa sinensis]
MRIVGVINKISVITLIDTGNTHSFIDPNVVRKARLTVEDTNQSVKLADGSTLPCFGFCKATPLQLQSLEVTPSLYLLALGGCDVVLGMDWLKTLGTVVWNFNDLIMSFTLGNDTATLRGIQLPSRVVEEIEYMEALKGNSAKGVWVQFLKRNKLEGTGSILAAVQGILDQFQTVFEEPSGLPPPRSHDHKITFLPSSNPTCVRPYRYLYYQKEEIENDRPKDWARWLHLTEYVYNTSRYSSIQISPYEAVYGQPPPQMLPYEPRTTRVDTVEEELRNKDFIAILIQENLQEAQNKMKYYADKNRIEREFEEGDWVYLRLKPYRQMSVATRRNLKLSPCYYRPFQILRRIEKVAYTLDLPKESQIFPTFHVSCLKKHIGDKIQPIPTLPQVTNKGTLVPELELVLQRRLKRKGHRVGAELLVQWKGATIEDATWEDIDDLQSQYPDLVGKIF